MSKVKLTVVSEGEALLAFSVRPLKPWRDGPDQRGGALGDGEAFTLPVRAERGEHRRRFRLGDDASVGIDDQQQALAAQLFFAQEAVDSVQADIGEHDAAQFPVAFDRADGRENDLGAFVLLIGVERRPAGAVELGGGLVPRAPARVEGGQRELRSGRAFARENAQRTATVPVLEHQFEAPVRSPPDAGEVAIRVAQTHGLDLVLVGVKGFENVEEQRVHRAQFVLGIDSVPNQIVAQIALEPERLLEEVAQVGVRG